MSPQGQPSLNIFDLINSIGREFRAEWKAGNRPRMEDYLPRVLEDAREMLFRSLLPVDKRYRERAGEAPSPTEYLERFPAYQQVIGDAFDFSTSISMEALEQEDVQDAAFAPTFVAPIASRIGDYDLHRELGRGGFGVVYEAHHITRGNRVALKTLPTGQDGQQANADRLHRFRREFRSLSEINHPNLVGMQSLEVDGSQWFFTMDLIDGSDFLSYVAQGGCTNFDRLRSVLPQVVSGVMALHRHGIVHRDLKPSNVLVNGEGRVSILDFGLVAELQKVADVTQTRSAMFAGTPKYAAPEQMFGQRSHAADWYALGVMLYEALQGDVPFKGTDPMDVLRRKQQEDPPLLSGTTDVPEDLATLVDGLLPREPAERLTEAQITDMLGLKSDTRVMGSTTAGSITSHGSSTTSGHDLDGSMPEDEEIVLIGREQQLAQLETARQQLVESKAPLAVWVTGLSGEGKSALAETFLRPYRRSKEMLVLSGRCYDRESVPFKAIDSLIEPLVRHLRSLSSAELIAVLPEDIAMLAHLFPLLNRVKVVERRVTNQIQSLDSRQIRYRAFAALRELLNGLSASTPVVLMIDDLQWGDADSAAALHAMFLGDNAPNVMFLGTYRRDEVDESGFHRQWVRATAEREDSISEKHVSVKPLDQDQCVSLIVSRTEMPELDAREVVARLFDETKGNPYFLDQIIEGFQEGATDWQPVPLDQIIARKLSRLQDGARELLEIVAVAGKATDANEIAEISGGGPEVLALMTHMRSERLVRLVGSGESQLVDTWHDKIRETTLDQMPPDIRGEVHRKFAELIELSEGLEDADVQSYLRQPLTVQSAPQFSTGRVFDIAYHYYLGNDHRALNYQLLAGELAYQNYASEEALEYLNRVVHLLDGAEAELWPARLWHRLAKSSSRVMAFDASIEQFEAGLAYAVPGVEKALFYSGIASVHQTRARYDSAAHFHDLALAQIGRRRPRGLVAYLVALGNFAKLALFPERWLRRRATHPNEEESLELAIYVDLGQYIFDRYIPTVEYPAAVMRMGVLSHRADTAGFCAGVGFTAAHLGISGFSRLGKRLAQRAIRRLDASVDAEREGICHYGAGVGLSYSADFENAAAEFNKAIPLLLRSGCAYFLAPTLHMKRHLYEAIGSARIEVEVAEQLVALTNSSGDLRSLLMGKYDHAGGLARSGEVDASVEAIQQAHDIWAQCKPSAITAIYIANRSFLFLQASEYEIARNTADICWRTAVKNVRVMDVCLRGLAWYLESVAGPHWLTDPDLSARKAVRKRCRWARLLAKFHVKIRPHLLRSRGRAFIALGRTRKGIRSFERAVDSARKLGMKYDLGKALLDLAAVKKDGREENRAEAIRLLKEMESVIPRAESWLLGDQYDEAVVAPEFDLAAWEAEHGPLAHPEEEDL